MNDELVSRVADWIRGANCVVVLTGAGISTESGIPDFRGPQGVWTRNPGAERLATIDHYLSSREARVQAWRNRLESPMWRAEPNAGHYALVELERKGKLDTLITQNVDGLHQKAGSSPERVVEIHGTVHRYVCLNCGDGGPIEDVLERVRKGEEDPPCRRCGGILKSATISFGQNLIPEVLERCYRAAQRCDLFLAIGTSLVVYPAAYLPGTALENGARLVIINGEPTPYDDYAHAVLHGRIGEVLPAIVERV
ncbi:MAG: NAD-dependent deacylase [Chloroflexota bacterium]|nr:NAD-dependent deacylase [Dehalococcoidia bacterium]MDW8045899.1 NAD-dependent deacylase [Chloroflexota bacterium]